MQPIKYLTQRLFSLSSEERYLFALRDFRSLFPDLSESALRVLLSRAVAKNILVRVCRNIYLFENAMPRNGLLLFHVAGLLRADKFNYISLETVLSDEGVISQVPISWITIMSSGRSNVIQCKSFGTIEFIHTKQAPDELVDDLNYDHRCKMWRATKDLALKDMKRTHRNTDLIDWEKANELI